MNAHTPAPLVYKGHVIVDKGDMLSLTDMWKTAGEPENKRPAEWIRYEGAAFIQFVAESHNVGIAHIIKGQRGKGGSTFAHWQIGIAYAKYLDHGFHMWANSAVREKMEGKASSLPSDTAALIARTDGIVRQMHHKVTGIERDNADRRATVARLEAKIEDTATGFRRAGVTARQIWQQHGLPALKSGTLWLGNRLKKMGAAADFGARADIGGKPVRLFDPDKAKHCMDNGLLLKAKTYRPVQNQPGKLEIVGDEAATVVRIFEMYAGGVAPRAIASYLNQESIPAPRGEKWNASTLNGNGQRQNGILRNPIYNGKIVWNRVRMIKDPTTGKRVSRINEEADLETTDAPQLRIVPEHLFEAVQKRKVLTGGPLKEKQSRSKRMLSGLLKCGACGGGMVIVGPDRGGNRIQCSTFRESGTCTNNRRFYIERVEEHVLASLRSAFADVSGVEAYIRIYDEELKRARGEALKSRATAQHDMDEAKAEITRVITMATKDIISEDELPAMLAPLRIRRDKTKQMLESIQEPVNVIELQPKAVIRFRENIEELAKILRTNDGDVPPELAAFFRQLIAAVVVEPTGKGEPYTVSIKAYLSSLISSELSVITMVAGKGLEPPTRGL